MLSLNTDKKNLPIAITMGDPSGINSEIILKSFNKISNNKEIDFFIICDPNWIKKSKKIFNIDVPLNIISNEIKIKQNKLNILPIKNKVFSNLGKPDKKNNKAILESLNISINLAKKNKVCGIVTLPIYKKNIMEGSSGFIGHTEYLAEKDDSESLMILMSKDLKVATITTHIPISKVSKSLTRKIISKKIKILHESLRRDFHIKNPKIAVSSLNPHSGEEGSIGKEEVKIILPCINNLKELGMKIEGPLPADTLFYKKNLKKFDARICMYHDQALIPLKTIDFYGGINFTAGLSFVRTSPDHGTAFNLAGKNKANPKSFIYAIRQAFLISKNRKINE
ncbi:MAG: 4-hydroxythreonine-4-phosphate dehydrogenase PdxA [Rhodobiaceae bacterium]|nr:4-hydroxythreonine-4-phosphate dehydrogenase PdxA [Rhodobiaceae bacterium]|tara:strand:+ start:3344 stop:4357 length:1014 start_codon:yes stop_codon:yes gene_type:complete